VEYDRHIQDYRHIQTNREMIELADITHMQSGPVGQQLPGLQMRVSEYAEPNTVYIVPDGDVLRRIHRLNPMEDLRMYFGCIKNVSM
jgi:hypothetical protein